MLAGLLAGLLVGARVEAAPEPADPPAGDPASRDASARELSLRDLNDSAPPVRVQLSPRRSTVLSSQLAGRIAELEVREGERFAEGQKLAVFDCAVQRARLAKAQAAREGARQTLAVKRRLQTLNSVSNLEVEVAAAEAAQMEAEVAAMTATVGYCAIAAPFPGRVVELKVRRYQHVTEGQGLMEILDDSELEAEMIVPSRWLAWLKPGWPLVLALDETGREYPAEVTRLGARIDPVSQSVKVFARISGRFDELLAGMSGTVRFTSPQ